MMLMPICASAQDLSYQPINPRFGGNPFNSNHLLGEANAQNKYTDPNDSSNQTQAEIFAQQLQSRLLSSLSSQVVDAIFGDDPQQSGTIQFGGQVIQFDRGLDSVTLRITDQASGKETVISIPTLVRAS
ncbi:curli assembly protein CsgF [Sphingomonas carotinifaciens]|nr:curli assembly protein CsgF [Sphingomonas carotinifaciens]MBB4087886.1 curli production assembly/transport component CsgF [Sphingomonas carotinifaciens]